MGLLWEILIHSFCCPIKPLTEQIFKATVFDFLCLTLYICLHRMMQIGPEASGLFVWRKVWHLAAGRTWSWQCSANSSWLEKKSVARLYLYAIRYFNGNSCVNAEL